MQRCVWTLAGCRLVAERGFWFSVDVKEHRGSVWICDSPAAAKTDRTSTESLFCRMAVLCHHIKNLCVKKSSCIILFVFVNTIRAARRSLKDPSTKTLRDSVKWPTSEMIWIFDALIKHVTLTVHFPLRKCDQDNIFYAAHCVLFRKRGRNSVQGTPKKKKKSAGFCWKQSLK